MRARHEPFGRILALDRPAAMAYVDRVYMRELGYAGANCSSGMLAISVLILGVQF